VRIKGSTPIRIDRSYWTRLHKKRVVEIALKAEQELPVELELWALGMGQGTRQEQRPPRRNRDSWDWKQVVL
jgi:hypothetical protein